MPELENKALKDEIAGGAAGHTTGSDSIFALHKMSTTAGLGSQDYVAVNGAAVAAIVLGISSILAYLHNVLLVAPLAGIVLGGIAIRQINRSNGTQTGKGLAVGGIVLSLLIGGALVVGQAAEAMSRRGDREQIVSLIKEFGQHVNAEQWEEAYGLYSRRFQQRVPLSDFTRQLQAMQSHPMYGSVESFEWNGAGIQFQVDPGSDIHYARAGSLLKWERIEAPYRQEFIFSRTGERWRIEDLPGMFGEQPAE